jgi:hypothetical protein
MLVPQHAEAEAKNPSAMLGKFKDSREGILIFDIFQVNCKPSFARESSDCVGLGLCDGVSPSKLKREIANGVNVKP